MPLARPSRIALLALTCVALATSGCGLIFSKGPPAGHEQMDYFTCTESDVGPILDVVWGSLNLLGALSIASNPEAYEETYGVSSSSGIAIGIAWAGISTASAVTGLPGDTVTILRTVLKLISRNVSSAPPACTFSNR